MEKNMDYCKVTAIFRTGALESVEQRLQELGVQGISVTSVGGYGEYTDFYSREHLTRHLQIEIFTSATRADAIAQAIMDAAYSGAAGDGIVAVQPVCKVYRIRQRVEVGPDAL
jgi:nitrogen regulatory protein P-II 1